MCVGNVSETIEVERWWSLGCRDGSGWCVDGHVGLFKHGRVWVFEDLLIDDDVLPFLVVDDGGRCGRGVDGETGAVNDCLSEFGECDSLTWVGFEDSTEDGVEFVGEREDGLEEVWIAKVGSVSLIAGFCSFPWVASTSEVDKDDTKGPDVVGTRLVTRGAGSFVTFR